MPADDAFADVLAANAAYARDFRLAGLPPQAARGLAVVTCMDSRIEPLAMLGLQPGDAKIVRNAGARVGDDVVRTLVLARERLGVERVMVVAHTQCAAAESPEQQAAALRADVERVRTELPGIVAAGFVYDVDTGRLDHRS